MSNIHSVANVFKIKLAQQFQIREYPMGDPKNPNLENVVKNIQTIIDGVNSLSANSVAATQLNDIVSQLNELGINFNP